MEHWVISDTHFGHHNILKFEPDFFPQATIDERDEMLIELWNQTVAPKDKIWHLGDVAFNTRLPLLKRLNGVFDLLVMGNHEHKNVREYLPYFNDVKASAEMMGCLFSHYPVHPSQFGRYIANIHGHTHNKKLDDDRYICVSIEQTGLKPINVSELETRVANLLTNLKGKIS